MAKISDPATVRLSEERPAISFSSVTFSDGQTLSFEDDETVVFVGPNNAGKSATLRELQSRLGTPTPQVIVKNATIKKIGTREQFREYLEQNTQKTGTPENLQYGGLGFSIHHSHLQFFESEQNFQVISPFFCSRVATEQRINGADPGGAIALYQDAPSHPIHYLLMDDKLAVSISELFRRAFGKDLIVFRNGGSHFPLYVGEKPVLAEGETEFSRSYIERLLDTAVPLQKQGDGMRSFATVLIHALATENHSVQFLDEPEAFLHPPQARLLGEYIAAHRRTRSQLFIATHSTDILDGLIAGGNNKVRIIRIQRSNNTNKIKELSREKTAAIANDTLTQYSGVFAGIFYKHVFITESDGDCLFYNSILNLPSISGVSHPDVLFIHASGKHRMGKLASTLRDLDVSLSVIADIDILNDESTFRRLFETLGGIWEEICGHYQTVKTSVEALGPPLKAEQVRSMIIDKLANIDGAALFPKDIEKGIKGIFNMLSPWDTIKHVGRSALRGGGTIAQFDQLCLKCAAKGLWIVPVGELEGFCRSIEARHGPAFVEKILEERDLETDPELEEARIFIRNIWQAQAAAG
jgi:ABC-type transporter Mla maintaining outer membrane lipid asymmetry ATPase subunit MlaF